MSSEAASGSNRVGLSEELSLYLDAVRFVAALVVFISHFSLHRFSSGFLWQFRDYGHEAVTVFFVLSGFVIAYATDTRERDARSYVISRCARIYSVAFPAVVLTVVLDQIGSAMRPDVYSAAWGFVPGISFSKIFAALSFTNEVWASPSKLGSNASYWSMGYEVPYYVIFGLALYTPARWRALAVTVALLAVGPSVVMSLPIWLAGVAAYRYSTGRALPERTGLLVFFASCLVWVAYEIAAWQWGRPNVSLGPYLRRQEVLQDCIVGACFAASLVGFAAASKRLGAWLLKIARPVRWLAGASFTLYLGHEPIAQFLLACMPWPASDARSRTLVFFGTLVAVFVLAEFTERRKPAWRRLFERLWPLSKRTPTPGPTP